LKIYPGLEGARAWLAWSVVLWHFVQLSGAASLAPASAHFGHLAEWAVEVFIIVSGFVITHLITTRWEGYGVYLARRALRLYPAYLVALLAGILTAPLWYSVSSKMAWLPPVTAGHAALQASEYHARFLSHLLAHLSLAHGAIPDEILPTSQFMFLPPAWSISLEWQFYLVAPAVLWIARWRLGQLALLVGVVAGVMAYSAGLLGTFSLPSALPGAAHLFAFGIATRLAMPRAPVFTVYPWQLVGVFALTLLIAGGMFPLFVWAALVAYFLTTHVQPTSFNIVVILKVLIDSRIARAAGARSYLLYIMHFPVIVVAVYAARELLGLGPTGVVAVGGFLALVGLLATVELVHQTVEQPAIRLGRHLGRSSASRDA
jgi:peptidoglycan/LPS O-acetylase OafA/YrhL